MDQNSFSGKGSLRKKHVPSGKVHTMLRDVLAVVWGPRSAALLSYVYGPGQHTICALRQVITMMETCMECVGIDEYTQPGHVAILLSDDSLLMIHIARLRDRGMPRGISFVPQDNDGHSVRSKWINNGEQQQLEQSLHQIVGCLERHALTRHDAIDMIGCLSEEGITLGIHGVPCSPTLYGWILGYPITYIVEDEDHASKISRCLSSNALVLYTLRTKPDMKDSAVPDDFDILMSFSIPQNLHGKMAEDIVMKWELMMVKECQATKKWCGWSPPRLDMTTEAGGCIVL